MSQELLKLKPYFLAARPVTLIAAVAPVLLGTNLALKNNVSFNLLLFICCLGSAIAIQVATNYFNDALDFLQGADSNLRQGPRRMVSTGQLSPQQMQSAAVLAILVAIILALPMLIARGWPILAIGIPSLIFAYGYTGNPIKLAYRGLGEIFVILFFGLIAVSGAAFVQSNTFSIEALTLGLQSGLLAASLVGLNNLRDLHEDSQTGKKTFAVRFGAQASKISISIFLAFPILIQILLKPELVAKALMPATALVSIILYLIWNTKTPNYQVCLFASALTYLSFTIGYLL